MIVLITDYGYQGPYVGQLKAKVFEHSPGATVIDLMHDLPAFNIHAAAVLIPAITRQFPNDTIFVCVVDPGVGSDRKALLLKVDSNYFIGPDNGMFDNLLALSNKSQQWEILWRPKLLSNSFHGHDLFVPIACQLYNKTLNFESSLAILPLDNNLRSLPTTNQIVYFDGFGNALTSVKQNIIDKSAILKFSNFTVTYSRVFSEQS